MYEVNARGLSCSESVMLTIVAPRKCKGEPMKVPVNEPHTRIDVEKYAKSQDKTATVAKKGSEFEIAIEQYRCPGFTVRLNQGF